MVSLSSLSAAVDTATVAGSALWAIALYWGCFPQAERLIAALERWLGSNSPAASLLGVVPFLLVGVLVYGGLTLSLGASWALSLGVIGAMVCGVYELGRRDGQASK
jgi:hypothetical protein